MILMTLPSILQFAGPRFSRVCVADWTLSKKEAVKRVVLFRAVIAADGIEYSQCR
jgi:hypothetical protein